MSASQPGNAAWQFLPITTIPTALDVVWCRFPFTEIPDQPGPKERPALVRSVKRTKDGFIYVEVCYGTSKLNQSSGCDLYVGNMREMALAGLPQATAFQLNRCVTLPWAEDFFATRAGHQTPVVGHLGPTSIEYLRHLTSRAK